MPFRYVANITRGDKTEPPTDHVIPSERSESRNLPKWQILPCVGTFLLRGGFLHSANATVGMTKRGYVSTNSPTVSRVFYAAPPLISLGYAEPASPEGKLLYRPFGCRVYRNATGKLSKPSPPGKGDRPQAVDEGRYGVVRCRNNGRRGKTFPPHVIPSERSESRNPRK